MQDIAENWAEMLLFARRTQEKRNDNGLIWNDKFRALRFEKKMV